LIAVAAASNNDTASFLRGKAFIAGVRDDTPLSTACDVYLVLEVEGVPGKEMKEWRRRLDKQVTKSKPVDRESWGLAPEQIAATQKLMRASGG
jgi:hypothetical protein